MFWRGEGESFPADYAASYNVRLLTDVVINADNWLCSLEKQREAEILQGDEALWKRVGSPRVQKHIFSLDFI